jgi:hypothetical protein
MAFVEDHVRTAVVLEGGRVRWHGPTTGLFAAADMDSPLRPPPLYSVWERLELSQSSRPVPLTPASLRRALAERAA